MNKKLVLLGAAALLSVGVASAQKRVTGVVVDSQGEPVIGAAVRVEGGKGAVATDENGRFVLNNVSSTAKTLKITSIGKQAKTVSIAGNVRVVLADDDKVLDEAVVVGYGSARKVGTLVGSVSKVNSDAIANKPSTNVADALQGKVAGMQVLTGTSDAGSVNASDITIRGTGSLGASSTPLLVIDGSPAEMSALGLINPNDIESVVTLKDASATSIYGSRASNGVIYITTKKGRRGEKAVVTISQKVGWSQLARSIGSDLMSASELLDFQLENQIITAADYQRYKAHGANTDWQKFLFRNDAPMYQTDFSVRGGSDKSTYFVSGSYLNNTGIDDQSHMDRYTLRANLEAQPKDWMTFGLNQSIIYTDRQTNGYTKQGGGGYSYSSQVLQNPRYYDPYDPSVKDTHKIWGGDFYDVHWLQAMQLRTNNDIIYQGNAFIALNPVKGLTLKSQLGVYAVNSQSTYTSLKDFPGSEGKITRSRGDSRSAQWTITNTAEYKFNVGEDHNIILLAGQEGIKYTSDGFEAGASGSTDDRLTLISNQTEATISDVSESKSAYQFLSFFGRADYTWKNKLFANFTLRNDQSSRFGKTNRSAMFYSGGVMYNLKRDYWLRPATWLDELELRLSVGSTGNSAIGNYNHLGIVGQTQYGGVPGWALSQPANTELGWETQIQTNFGVRATFFTKLTVDLNVYHRKTKDMLQSVPIPTTTGFSSQAINIGSMSNRGVEVEVDYNILRTRDYFLTVGVNYAFNRNRIDELFYGFKEWEMKEYLLNYVVGKSLNFYMPIYAGVDKEDGRPMWYKVGHKGGIQHEYNPETMTKDESQIDNLYQDTGKAQEAPHTGGFNIQAGWKGLTLSANFSYVLGKYMIDNEYLWNTGKSNLTSNKSQAHRDMLNIWKQPGDIATLPAFEYQSQFDTHLLQNASFLRLKDLTLAYDLPKKWMDATGFIQGIRLSFVTRNLFTITKFKGADPEIGANLTRGNYPATRQFQLGIDVTF